MMERRRKKMFQFSMEFHRKSMNGNININFCTLGPLVWKWVRLYKITISQINTNLYSVPKINVFKIQKGPVNNNFSYWVETILSTDMTAMTAP
jgi:hypothetical protein